MLVCFLLDSHSCDSGQTENIKGSPGIQPLPLHCHSKSNHSRIRTSVMESQTFLKDASCPLALCVVRVSLWSWELSFICSTQTSITLETTVSIRDMDLGQRRAQNSRMITGLALWPGCPDSYLAFSFLVSKLGGGTENLPSNY